LRQPFLGSSDRLKDFNNLEKGQTQNRLAALLQTHSEVNSENRTPRRDRESRKGAELPYETELGTVLDVPACVDRLAELFPSASPVRIPVQLSTMSVGRQRLQERTVIEFGTSQEVLFGSSLPLEFEDRIHIATSDHSLDVRATVVAVRYDGGRKAVAARFESEVENWIIKP
jgi:hypothetical protein